MLVLYFYFITYLKIIDNMNYLKLRYIKYILLILFLYILFSLFIRIVNIYTLLFLIIIVYIFYNIDKKLFKKIVYKVIYKNKKKYTFIQKYIWCCQDKFGRGGEN